MRTMDQRGQGRAPGSSDPARATKANVRYLRKADIAECRRDAGRLGFRVLCKPGEFLHGVRPIFLRQWDCLEIGGVRPQPLLAGADRWRAGISVRSRSRACHYRRRSEPEAEDPPLAATSAFAAICSSGGSPENWPSLR